MFAQCGAKFATVRSVAREIYQKKYSTLAVLALLAIGSGVSGCAVPIRLSGQDPEDPEVKVAQV